MRKLLAAFLVVLVLAGAAAVVTVTGALGSVTYSCHVGGVLAGGMRCVFTNTGAFFPGKGCVKAIVTKDRRGLDDPEGTAPVEAKLRSLPVCSGLVWGGSTTEVPIAFEKSPQKFCGTLDECSLSFLHLVPGEQ